MDRAAPERVPPHLRPSPMDHTIGGDKPSQYSRGMAGIILARARAGETLKQITADPAMPSHRTLYDWLDQHVGFGAAWSIMRRDQARARRREALLREARRLAAREVEPRRRSGRRTTFTPERGEAFCDLIRQGFSARAAARRPGMPSLNTVYYWLRRHPEFQGGYVEACRARDFRIWLDLTVLADEANLAGLPVISRRAAVVEKHRADSTPKVWRWD